MQKLSPRYSGRRICIDAGIGFMTGKMNEFELIRMLTAQRGIHRKDVLLGVGDDAAVVDANGKCLLFTCDAQIDGTHYLRERISPYILGQRIAAVNLSDIAAMGGEPLWALCSLVVDSGADAGYFDELYRGLYDELGRFSVQLIGGNVARTDASAVTDLFLVGQAEKEEVLYRSGARVGDLLCVTGTLGDSAAGLKLLMDGPGFSDRYAPLVHAHQRPVPRIEVGRVLSGTSGVTACMDISDGLLQDAMHLADASGIHLNIDDTEMPLHPLTIEYASASGQDAVVLALSGGEDYELLFTVNGKAYPELARRIDEETGVPVTVIGEVVPPRGNGMPVQPRSDRYRALLHRGFDHLHPDKLS